MTGSPTAFCQVVVPSTIVAKSAYECVWSMVSASKRTEKSMGIAAGASIRCWPMTTPASAAAVWSTMVTIATASGVSVICSSYDNDPVTDASTALIGTANAPPSSATVAASSANCRRWGRNDDTADLSAGGRGRILRIPRRSEA